MPARDPVLSLVAERCRCRLKLEALRGNVPGIATGAAEPYCDVNGVIPVDGVPVYASSSSSSSWPA